MLLRFAGNEKGVDFQSKQALSELADQEAELIEPDHHLWSLLASVPAHESFRNSWAASVLPSRAIDLIEGLAQTRGASLVNSLWQLGIADGRLRMLGSSEGKPDLLQAAVASVGGTLITEDGLLDNASTPKLAGRIKQELDPQGIFDRK